jgi:hypothetical protein
MSVVNQTFTDWKVYLIGDDYDNHEEFLELARMIPEDKIYCDDGDWKEQTDKLHDEWVAFKLVTKKELIHA